MVIRILTFALLASIAAAAPVAEAQQWNTWFAAGTTASLTTSSKPTSTNGGAAPLKSGNPFSFQLSDGFPSLSAAALNQTSVRAQGIEPNEGAPTLVADDLTSIQLIAFNEIFEVAYFTSLITNITTNVQGYGFQDQNQRKVVLDALTAVQAQEELHADNVNKILAANKLAPIQPCQYTFPVSNLKDALDLAATFTDVVLGTLQDVQLKLAMNGDAGVVPIIGSVIGQEGEQTGFYRSQVGKVPSAKPFLTRSTREFAFSALNQVFVVPGSCPNSNTIKLDIFQSLTVNTANITAKDQSISYSFSTKNGLPSTPLSLVLINGQSEPIVSPIQHAQNTNGVLTFDAFFPYTDFVLDGLTIAAVTTFAGPFASAEDVAKVTIAGPGLIEIN